MKKVNEVTNNIMEVSEMTETTQTAVEGIVETANEKKGLISKIKGLKTWQKIALGATAVAGIGTGAILLLKKGNSEEIVETVVEAATDVIES